MEYTCRAYLPLKFNLAWSQDHRDSIDIIEKAIWGGGLFALAMPRGSGKSALVVAADLWARLNGYRRFVAVIGSDEDHAIDLMKSGKAEVECNQAFLEDFPEVCYPIRRLEGIAQRANAQTYLGKRTYVGWKEDELVFPTIPGSVASGAIVRVAGITGSIRGMQFTRPDGETVRPDLCIPDDPQTDASAKSPQQVKDRVATINGTILGLAGPGQTIAAIMPCTVIEPGDASDQLTDRATNPEWQGKRYKMLYGWPTNEDLWHEYKRIRDESFRSGEGIIRGNEFYKANQPAMDEGARAAWEVRKDVNEISAIQHAMNLYFKVGKQAFFSEYQNEPIKPEAESLKVPTAEEIKAKANGMPRGIVPRDAMWLVSFIDVQQDVLFFGVVAVSKDFSAHVVDYGSYPDQKSMRWTKATLRQGLMEAEGAKRKEEAIRKGLDSLASLLLPREFKGETGSVHRIARCLVDAQYEPEIVKQFCRQSAHSAVLTPRFGVGIQAKNLPVNERKEKEGENRGLHWRQPAPKPYEVRTLTYDTNWWKTFFFSRLVQAFGGAGCLTIFGDPEDHELLISHLQAEYPTETFGHGRKVVEWQHRPTKPDNDWLDTLVGCLVAGSLCGAVLAELAPPEARKRRRISLAELQQKAKLYSPHQPKPN